MTAATMTASGIGRISIGRPDHGMSSAATDLADRMRGLSADLREPLSVGGAYQEALASLRAIEEDSAVAGWDGYEALPVDRRAVEHAARILEALPTNIPAPEIDADPDGEVSLEWYRDPDWVLSISIGPRGEFTYAGRFGRSRIRGIEEGTDDIPAPLLGQLDRFITGIPA